MDWVNFTSAFRAATPETVFPWPPLCCRRTGNFIPLNEEGCRLGHLDYLFTKVCPLPLLHLTVVSPALSGSSISSPLPLSLCHLLFPSLAFSFSPFSLVLSTLPPSVLPSFGKSAGCTQGLSDSGLAPATLPRLSGNMSSNNDRNSKTPITTHIS